MEEKKRLTATKAAITKFREEHPTFTDDYLVSSVERTYPNLYLDNLNVAVEIVKELYRRQEDLTDESFIALLREMTEGRKLVRYGKEVIKTGQIMAKYISYWMRFIMMLTRRLSSGLTILCLRILM